MRLTSIIFIIFINNHRSSLILTVLFFIEENKTMETEMEGNNIDSAPLIEEMDEPTQFSFFGPITGLEQSTKHKKFAILVLLFNSGCYKYEYSILTSGVHIKKGPYCNPYHGYKKNPKYIRCLICGCIATGTSLSCRVKNSRDNPKNKSDHRQARKLYNEMCETFSVDKSTLIESPKTCVVNYFPVIDNKSGDRSIWPLVETFGICSNDLKGITYSKNELEVIGVKTEKDKEIFYEAVGKLLKQIELLENEHRSASNEESDSNEESSSDDLEGGSVVPCHNEIDQLSDKEDINEMVSPHISDKEDNNENVSVQIANSAPNCNLQQPSFYSTENTNENFNTENRMFLESLSKGIEFKRLICEELHQEIIKEKILNQGFGVIEELLKMLDTLIDVDEKLVSVYSKSFDK